MNIYIGMDLVKVHALLHYLQELQTAICFVIILAIYLTISTGTATVYRPAISRYLKELKQAETIATILVLVLIFYTGTDLVLELALFSPRDSIKARTSVTSSVTQITLSTGIARALVVAVSH